MKPKSHSQRLAERRKVEMERHRPSARARGYDQRWRQARARFLREHPRCENCGAPATVVDHIVPHRQDRRLFWDAANWQALCTRCHNAKTARECFQPAGRATPGKERTR